MKYYLPFLILLFATNVTAQHLKGVHSFNIWGAGGYSNLFVKNSAVVSNNGNVGGIIGLGYGYRFYSFMFETGIEFDYKSSSTTYNDFSKQVGTFIDENTGEEIPLGTPITSAMRPVVEGGFVHTEYNHESKFAMQYNFTGLQDKYKIGYINIPLRVGGAYDFFYFLVGPKFGLNVLSYANANGTHSSVGYFPQDIGFLSEMPHHSFVNNRASGNNTQFSRELNFNLAASLEVGINLLFALSRFNELRLALFADYGVLNINSINTNSDFVYIPATNQVGIDPNSITYNSLANATVNPFIAGIKITAVFAPRNTHSWGFSYKSDWWVIDKKKGDK